MRNSKKDIDISGFSSQIQTDILRIFQWLENNVRKPHSEANEPLLLFTDEQTTVDKIHQALESFDYPYQDFDVDHYIAYISRILKREINLVPMELSRALSGACVRQSHVDHIFYNEKRHRLLQEHIIIHESAHLLLNHRLRKVKISSTVRNLKDISNQSRVRFRSHLICRDLEQQLDEIEKQQEQEAETFAQLFLANVQIHKRHQRLTGTQNINLFPPFSDES